MVYAAGVSGSGSIGLTWDAGTLASWFDRYLAPHGIRTKVSAQMTGQIDVWVECQQEPERDRLVRFICHRLHGLNLAAVEGVRIMARRVGQPELLWQQSVQLEQRPGLSSTAYYQQALPRSPEQQVMQRLAHSWLVARDGWSALATATRDRWRSPVGMDLGTISQWLQPVGQSLGAGLTVDRLNGRCLVVEVQLPPEAAMAATAAAVTSSDGESLATSNDASGNRSDSASESLSQPYIVQTICRRLWQFNASEQGQVSGVRIRATVPGQVDPLWQQTIRIAAPAGRRELGLAGLTQWATDPALEPIWRSVLLGGATIVPFVLALWLASSSPDATRSRPQQPAANPRSGNSTEQVLPLRPAIAPVANRVRQVRPPVVQGALELLPVVNHPPANPTDPAVTLMFGGDVTLSDRVKRRLGGDWSAALAQFPESRSVDVAMVNLENPITDADRRRSGKRFNFRAEPESVAALEAGGIDLVTLANNHTMDYNRPGLLDTLAALDQSDIHAIGAGENITEARRPKILEVKGQRIAYFGYYNAHWHAATETSAGTNPRENEALAADIQAVRDQVDWVVVNFHWGEELARYPAPYQRSIARRAIDAGADLVVGHHPHVLQGAEVYKDRAIVYSLGNFIFGGHSRSTYDTAVLKVALRDRQMKVDFVPVRVQNYQPRVAKGDRAKEILQELTYISRRFDQPLTQSMVLTARSAPNLAPNSGSGDFVSSNPGFGNPGSSALPMTITPTAPLTATGDRPQPQLPSFTRSAATANGQSPIVVAPLPSSSPAVASAPIAPQRPAQVEANPISPSDDSAIGQRIQASGQSARDRLAQLMTAVELSELVRNAEAPTDEALGPSNRSVAAITAPAGNPSATPSPMGSGPRRSISFEIGPEATSSEPAAGRSTTSPQLPFTAPTQSGVAQDNGFTAAPSSMPANYSSLSLPALVKSAADRAQAILEP
ncbi:MAG: hypothetical protein BJG00_002600 [Limnothrix sp. CACIAM 69d]|nr:MAG: hypothetical protein BJG00_002600 [Limnothrix sp. CACIAM 69d]